MPPSGVGRPLRVAPGKRRCPAGTPPPVCGASRWLAGGSGPDCSRLRPAAHWARPGPVATFSLEEGAPGTRDGGLRGLGGGAATGTRGRDLRGVASVVRSGALLPSLPGLKGKMAAPWWRAVLCGSRGWRGFSTSAALSRRTPPLGPMPNEDIDVSNLDRLKKYRSFDRYRRQAEQEAREPHWWRTYREHFREESDPKDKIDIGLPPPKVFRTQQLLERKRVLQELRANVEEERAARLRTTRISLEAVRAEWEKTCGPYHKQRLAEYYGLYRDLLGGATFVPRVPLQVAYAVGEHDLMPVYHGNEVTPTEAAQAPEVTYEADEGSMWTLLLTNLDGHLLEPDAEYVHWLVTNIPGNRMAEGQETCPYLPPFPAQGTGFHRFAFLLFKQDKPIDFSGDTRPSPCYQLAQRTFHTFDFYKKHQDAMTPAGLAFFQCRWDDSVTHVFHHLLEMREPVFEFVRPPPYHPKQKRFPHREPLRYLDRYRDSHEPTYGIY